MLFTKQTMNHRVGGLLPLFQEMKQLLKLFLYQTKTSIKQFSITDSS
ncbi:hypothetical protein ACOMCU_07745 [Lysinibacillus sp. UGB7]